jgi:hypothetical protein
MKYFKKDMRQDMEAIFIYHLTGDNIKESEQMLILEEFDMKS